MQTPTHIHYDRANAQLTITWPDQTEHVLSAEFLRVHSPSAEVRGHGVGQEVLQFGKKDVGISGLENAGRYALKIIFDDGHDSGLFDWNYLRSLGDNQTHLWKTYMDKLDAAGQSREPQFIAIKQL
ncbi:gamma-butyrobetaine hydroxylase-like domain-containing protein [Reinekea blandensis]|uniref:Gamma-butyrobetaine hydroxylase-like N-terminal domain-containing protein n=1 Tax=Reinekea blandensis MED297 TaxID=314283 RepID=A4BGC9_9GAMM|nr:DUF971 domain-containing protein [Reinekea blandensis]EAR08924.1 hypothetical protein MED297_04622 [Reinekea sp. MED297] [Reinekea blandensis MED297]